MAKALKKNAVLVKDAPAFVVNRLLTRLMGEVTKAVDEGTPIEVADTALRPLGLPMTPFALLQLVGPAVALHVAETLHEAFGDRFRCLTQPAALVAAKKPGIYDLTPRGPAVRLRRDSRPVHRRRLAEHRRSRSASGRPPRWPRRSA